MARAATRPQDIPTGDAYASVASAVAPAMCHHVPFPEMVNGKWYLSLAAESHQPFKDWVVEIPTNIYQLR